MEVMWVIGTEVCDKMIPEKILIRLLIVSAGKLILMIGKEFQSQQIQLK